VITQAKKMDAVARIQYIVTDCSFAEQPESVKKDAQKSILITKRRLAESNRRIKVLQTSPLPLG
jgi:hypothetical protein